MRFDARFLLAFATAALAALPLPAAAQGWPARPVKIVIPVAPAGALDPIARAIAQNLSETWKQGVIVENRPGASQMIGADYVSKAEPDGYTLLISEASPFVMNPHLFKQMPFDAVRGFTPITLLVRVPWVIAVHPSVPAANFRELVAYAKAKPGAVSYGSFGLGSSVHIQGDYLKKMLGIDMLHVPYKGAGPAVTDLLGGQINMMMITPQLVVPHAQSGKLRLIASAMSQRIQALPELPTVAESGVPGFSAGTWFALFAPPGLPAELLARIHGDTVKILNTPAFREQYLVKQWLEPVGNTPAQFTEFLKAEHARWGELIKVSGVSVE